MRRVQGGLRLARSCCNVNISDRFIGPTDLSGWATRPYFRVAPTRLHPPKHGNPEITSPKEQSTRQQGILHQITFHKLRQSKPCDNVSR